MRIIGLMLLFTFAGLCAVRAAEVSPTTTPSEAELGAKIAAAIEKDNKLVADEAAVKRLDAIATAIAPVTERPGVVYTCKILDTRELNAMSIPGGTIYVTRGLLDAVESDHELAGVLAHEIAHNALCHAQKMVKRQAKASLAQIAAVITAVYVGHGTDVSTGELLTMSELVKRALLNGYNVDLEVEADAHAVDYLAKLGTYYPVGLYSVILGFQQMETHHPMVELGYLKTHPYSNERKELLETKLAKLGIRVNLWQVVNFHATVVAPSTDQDHGYTVRLGESDLIELTRPDGLRDAKTRAEDAVKAINRRLERDYIQQFDVDVDMYRANAILRLRRIPVLTLTPDDAAAAGMTLDVLGQLAMQRARESIWRETVKREG